MAIESTMNRGYTGGLAGRPTKYAGGVRRRDESRDAFRGRMDAGYAAQPGAPASGGLDEFHALQRGAPGNANAAYPGWSAPEQAAAARARGKQIGPGGQISQIYNPQKYGQQQQMGGTREQNIAQAKQNGTFADIRRKFNRENPGQRMNMRGDIMDRGNHAGGVRKRSETNEEFADRVTGSDQKGQVDAGANDYGSMRNRVRGGMRGGERGQRVGGVRSQQDIIAERRAALQALADEKNAGRVMEKDLAAGVVRTPSTISSKYGKAGLDLGGGPRRPTTVKDDSGRQVPIREFVKDRDYVTETQKSYIPRRY